MRKFRVLGFDPIKSRQGGPKSAIQNPKSCLNWVFVQALVDPHLHDLPSEDLDGLLNNWMSSDILLDPFPFIGH